MGFTLWIAGTPAVTRTLTVKYRRPVPLPLPVRLTAWIDEDVDPYKKRYCVRSINYL